MSNKSNLNYVFVAQTSDGEIKNTVFEVVE